MWKKFVDADISYTKINITLALFLLLITHKKTIGLNNLSDTFKNTKSRGRIRNLKGEKKLEKNIETIKTFEIVIHNSTNNVGLEKRETV